MRSSNRVLPVAAILVVALGACAAGSTPVLPGVPAASTGPARPAATVAPTPAGSANPSNGGATAPTQPAPGATDPSTATLTPDRAAALVLATNPRFAHAGPRNPRLVGQADWYEVRGAAPPYRVVVSLGWGDCQSGCIEHHVWTFDVAADGSVTLLGEAGAPLP